MAKYIFYGGYNTVFLTVLSAGTTEDISDEVLVASAGTKEDIKCK